MKNLKIVLFGIITILFTLTSCQKLEETGKFTTQEPTVTEFSKIDIDAKARINIYQGTPAISFEGDEGVINAMETTVENGKLTVQFDKKYDVIKVDDITINISVKDLSLLKIKGENTITFIDDRTLNNLEVELDGANTLISNGTANKVRYELLGENTIQAFDLVSQETSIRIIGESHAEVNCQDHLNVRIAGQGEVLYKGQPSIDKEILGEGRITDAN